MYVCCFSLLYTVSAALYLALLINNVTSILRTLFFSLAVYYVFVGMSHDLYNQSPIVGYLDLFFFAPPTPTLLLLLSGHFSILHAIYNYCANLFLVCLIKLSRLQNLEKQRLYSLLLCILLSLI